jgi:hypothetical protein
VGTVTLGGSTVQGQGAGDIGRGTMAFENQLQQIRQSVEG